jgi:hypothetical protein
MFWGLTFHKKKTLATFGKKEMLTNVWPETLKDRNDVGDLDADGIILIFILKL